MNIEFNSETTMDSLPNCSAGGGSDIGPASTSFNSYSWWEPVIREYYPVYYSSWIRDESKVEKAFKIVTILVDDGFVKLDKVKDFIKLVTKIADKL